MERDYEILLSSNFWKDEDDPKWINVTIPDIFSGVTCGDGKDHAIYMAKDLIRLMLLEAPNQCFEPKTLKETEKNFPNKKVVMVEVKMEEDGE